MSLLDRTNTYRNSKTSSRRQTPTTSRFCKQELPVNLTLRLPNEILSSIFLLASHHPRDPHSSSPMTLTHVCSRWRRVGIETGELWSTIIITFSISQFQLALALTWLNRSRAYPLDLTFDLRDPGWSAGVGYDDQDDGHPFQGDHLVPILRYFLPHVSRWRHFELLTDTWDPIRAFLSLTWELRCAPTILETLSLMRCNAYLAAEGQPFEPRAQRRPLPLFGGAKLPKLTALTLAGVHIDWTASLPALQGLTKLELKFQAQDVMPTFAEYAAIINASPYLEELVVGGWGPKLDPEDKTVLDLTALRVLSISLINLDYTHNFLSHIRCPALETLCIDDLAKTLNEFKAIDLSPLIEWLLSPASPSSIPLHQITSLQLGSVHTREEASLMKLFTAMPAVREVSVKAVKEDVLVGLISQESLPALQVVRCPRLGSPQTKFLCEALLKRGAPLCIYFGIGCDVGSEQEAALTRAGFIVHVEPSPAQEEDEAEETYYYSDSDPDSEEEYFTCEDGGSPEPER